MPSEHELDEAAIRAVKAHIPGVRNVRFQSREKGSGNGLDALLRTRRGVIVVEVKSARGAAVDEVLGQLAVGVLQARANCRGTDRSALVLVRLPRLGRKVKAAVEQFMAAHTADHGWGLVGEDGAVRLRIPALDVDVDQPGRARQPRLPRPTPKRLFTDLHRWMLKILLLADAPQGLWNGPRQPVATATELHRVAKVSVEKAHQFFRAFERAGFVRQTSRGLAVLRKRPLMEMWFHDELASGAESVPVRWIFGNPAPLEEVFAKHDATDRPTICGFEACRRLGVLHAPTGMRELYITGDLASALDSWSLEVCDQRDAELLLRMARFPQSILRGRLANEGLPVVDVLQAALDVCSLAARGREQADYILHHVLGWKDDD